MIIALWVIGLILVVIILCAAWLYGYERGCDSAICKKCKRKAELQKIKLAHQQGSEQ